MNKATTFICLAFMVCTWMQAGIKRGKDRNGYEALLVVSLYVSLVLMFYKWL